MTAIFVSGFDYDTDDSVVRKHFGACGAIEDLYFQSKGSAVITYAKESAANRAVADLDGSTMKGQTRYVSVKLDDPDRSQGSKGKGKGKSAASGTAIYVSGFDYETDESTLTKHFSGVGRIKELFFQSNGSAVITYNSADAASRAVTELNETTMKGQTRYVAVKLDEPDRKASKGKGKGAKGGSGRAVFVNGFDYDTDDSVVRKHFGACGAIEDLYFQSKGSAVVTYVKDSAASRALELDGSTMKGQNRYVSVKLDDPDRSKGKGKGKGKYW